MKVVTLVPYRPAGERHRWLWDQTHPALVSLGYPVYTGEPRGEAWSRAEAVNVAAENAGDWDVALVGDCDTIPDPGSIVRAIEWVGSTGGAARPHGQRIMLNQKGTIVFLQRGPAYLERQHYFRRQWAGGGLLVVTRAAWELVGGYDESFKGWGYEDSDFNLRLLRHSTWDRLPGSAWHLWHPTDDNKPSPETTERARALQREYRYDIERWAFDKGLREPMKVL